MTPFSGTEAGDVSNMPPPVIGGGQALLVVETMPDGVEVLLESTAVGETPLERTGLRAGTYDVTLRHPHYETLRLESQKLEDHVVLRIEQILVRGTGRVTVRTQPPTAWIERDGVLLARQTPVTLDGLPAGSVELTLGADEHRSVSVRVEVPKNGIASLERRLERIPYGTLTLEVVPTDAMVTLPDIGAPYTPGARLPEGRYTVEVNRPGYHEITRRVDVSGDTRMRFELEEALPCEGWNTADYFGTATAKDVIVCLDAGADLEARAEGSWTPLHSAAESSEHPAVVEALLNAGADLEARNMVGLTPLHVAALYGEYPAIIKALLAAGADLEARDNDGWTPLHGAVRYNRHPALIEVMLDAGADAKALNAGRTPWDLVQENDALQGSNAYWRLAEAVLSCEGWGTENYFAEAPAVDVIACLYAGEDLEARDESGSTPLHWAVAQSTHPAVVEGPARRRSQPGGTGWPAWPYPSALVGGSQQASGDYRSADQCWREPGRAG